MSQEEAVSISFWFSADCRGFVLFFFFFASWEGLVGDLGRAPSWAPVCNHGQVSLFIWGPQTLLFGTVAFYGFFFGA